MRKLLIFVALMGLSAAASAGESAEPIVPVKPAPVVKAERVNPALHGPNEFALWAAGTTNSPHVIALSSDRRVSMLGLRYGRRLFQTKPLAMTWTVDLDPVVLVSQPRNIKGANTGGREWIYGAALSPFGVRFDLMPRRRLQPFVNASGGMVIFTRPAPYSDATKRNYMFEAGFGLRFFERHGRAFTIGWKLNHISNNYRVLDNPGIDSAMLYTGISFFK